MDTTLELSDIQKLGLIKIARNILSRDKGILAADERPASFDIKFTQVGIANTYENRGKFRECLFSVPGLESYIGGVIVNEETFDQTDEVGALLIEHLSKKNIEIGVKLDKGLADFDTKEKISVGLEDLENRINNKKFIKATFSKWRSLFFISDGLPSDSCIGQNCNVLCKYAVISQRNGLVPIVEPEIHLEGSYDVRTMGHVAKIIYSKLYSCASRYNIFLPGMIMKVSFISSAKNSMDHVHLKDFGFINTSVITESVPPAVAGIVYLSGGHSEEKSFQFLSAIKKDSYRRGMTFSFSFGRALTSSFLNTWKGSAANIKEAQNALARTIEKCHKANKGEL